MHRSYREGSVIGCWGGVGHATNQGRSSSGIFLIISTSNSKLIVQNSSSFENVY